MPQKTVEKKAANRNGVKRMIFCGLSILLEIVLLVLLFTKLSRYAEWINLAINVVAIVLVLALYAQNKTSAMKMPWIILILAFPLVGLVMYLLLGTGAQTKKMRLRYEKIDEALLPMLPSNESALEALREKDKGLGGIATYIARNAKYPVYRGCDVTYFSTAKDGLDAQIAAMKNAKDFIFIEYHSIEDLDSWKRIEDVLIERVANGVEVRVFYDDVGSIGYINTSFAKKLQSLGIQCRIFNPCSPILNMFLNHRDHRKITVVDGKIGFTGGYNLCNEYFGVTHPYGEWKDTGIRIIGDAVRSLTVTFLEMWNAVNESDMDDQNFEKFLPAPGLPDKWESGSNAYSQSTAFSQEVPTTASDGFIIPYADSPMDHIHIGEDVYINLINLAQKTCYFITPYLIITDEMTHALCLAAMRGVDVRIITPGIPDKKLIYAVTRSFYRNLARGGIRIFEWEPGFCHAKMCLIDGMVGTCGTINLDYRSLYHHFENGCLLYHCQAVDDMRDDFEKTFSECREVTDRYRSGLSSMLRLGQLILRLFAELL